MKFFARILSLAVLVCLSAQARADLVGDTINFGEYNGATTGDLAFSLGTIVVPNSIDNFGFTTTITGNTITIAEDGGSTTCNTFNVGDICGLYFVDATHDPGFATISLDPSSTTNTLTGSIANGNVYLDFTNLTLNAGDVAVFDLTFNSTSAVPEPGNLLLLGTGALGLAGTLRKRILGR